MNYLFFDIECANCFHNTAKICEFGYILTDEKFNEIKAEEFVINPDAPFDRYTLKNILTFSKSEYKKAPIYPEFYDKIRAILLAPNQLVIGQATHNDAKFLKDESVRYNLDYIDFEYIDIGLLYKKLNNLEEVASLERMRKALDMDVQESVHLAEGDARSTMQVLKTICNAQKSTPESLVAIFPECKGRFDFTKKPKQKKKKQYKKEVV